MSNILDAAYRLSKAYPGGALSLTPRLGKSGTTLSQELTRSGTAKLGLETAVQMSVFAKEVGVPTYREILTTFAEELGCAVIDKPVLSEDETLQGAFQKMATVSREFAEFIGQVAGVDPQKLSQNQRKAIQKEGAELLAAVQNTMALFDSEDSL